MQDTDHLIQIDSTDQASQLEFQNFMLSSAEEDLIAGKIPTQQEAQTQPINFNQVPLNQQPNQPQSSAGFWTVEYWQRYFAVNTKDVQNRMIISLWPSKSFMSEISDNPDMYGPFWIPTTVIFCLFATSTIVQSIAHKLNGKDKKFEPNITLLSFATMTVYSYTVGLPALLYLTAKYYKAESVKLFDLISIFGYGMTVWIPTSILCVIPSELARWILVTAAFCLSLYFHLKTIFPLASSTNNRAVSLFMIGAVFVSQLGLALLFKIVFFQVSANADK